MLRTNARPPFAQTLAEFGALARPSSVLDMLRLAPYLPRGDGSIVLVLPPIIRGDSVTQDFRDGLETLGWDARGWRLGVNWGPTPAALMELDDLFDEIASNGQPIRLVGFSMGGLFARYLAHRAPASVHSVITVCSPSQDALNSTWLPLKPFLPAWGGRDTAQTLAARVAAPLRVPTTCLFSRRDGIVNWESCRDPSADCVEIDSAHVTIAHDPAVFRLVARRLAQS